PGQRRWHAREPGRRVPAARNGQEPRRQQGGQHRDPADVESEEMPDVPRDQRDRDLRRRQRVRVRRPRCTISGMSPNRTTRRPARGAATSLVIALAGCTVVAGCSTVPIPPTYTKAELRTICERRGGVWRPDIIDGYCEYQAASLIQSP